MNMYSILNVSSLTTPTRPFNGTLMERKAYGGHQQSIHVTGGVLSDSIPVVICARHMWI
jgi:hypothetical protein